jgi:hypothetical protein
MSDSISWTLTVSRRTDRALREFLASEGLDAARDLPRFVEEAVRAHIFELTADQAKARNAAVPPAVIEDAVDEAVEWARRRCKPISEVAGDPAAASRGWDAQQPARRHLR